MSLYPGFKFGEIAYALKLLGQNKSNAQIQKLFVDEFQAGEPTKKVMPGRILETIRIEHASEIGKKCQEWRKDIDGCYYSQVRLVLDDFKALSDECREEHATGRVNPVTGDEITAPDKPSAIRALDCGAKHWIAFKKYQLEMIKNGGVKAEPNTGTDPRIDTIEDVTKEELEESSAWEVF